MGIAFVGELADETDVFLYLFSLVFHLPDVVLAHLGLQTLQHVLVLRHYLQKLSLPIRLVQSLLFGLAQVLVHTGVGGFAAWVRRRYLSTR